MNNEQVEIFLKLQPQMESAYKEISLLSNKKPTDSLNKFKLKFINSILSRANEILGEYKPFPGEFDLFNEDDMPTNSDIVFIFSNYLTSLEKLRCDNIDKDSIGRWYWLINKKLSDKQTEHPAIM